MAVKILAQTSAFHGRHETHSVCLLSHHMYCKALLAITLPRVLLLQECSFTQMKHMLVITIQIVLCSIEPSMLPHCQNHLPDLLLLSPKGILIITSNLLTSSPPFL